MRTSAVIRTFTGVCVVGAVAAAMTAVASAQVGGNVNVSASVSRNCRVTITSISFPAYDPVNANATAELSGAGNLNVACTKGVAPEITLSLGSNADSSTRRMVNGTTEFLTYELYQPDGSTVWGAAQTGAFTADPAESRAARDFQIVGRVPGGQDAAAGNYADTVVATVNF